MEVPPKLKKRGRKPKGGKIIPNVVKNENDDEHGLENIVVHLKCTRNDVEKNNNSISASTSREYTVVNEVLETKEKTEKTEWSSSHNKIFELHFNYKNNTIYDKNSCCFWDTCPFIGDPIHIIKSIDSAENVEGYGHFCSPECALAYLMNEHIDASVKYERCALLHNHYSTGVAFKPAPSPQYILDKFYGNFTIEEYRELSNKPKYIMVINKPIRRVFPEIHEDSSDFIMKNKIIPTHNEGCNYNASTKMPLSNFVITR